MTQTLAVIIALQWIGLIGLGLVVLGLARQIGVLHNRLGPAGALMLSKGVKVGEPSPKFRLQSIEGGDVVLGGSDASGQSTLVMFVAPDCPVCASLIPTIKSIAKAESGRTRVIFASDGDPEKHRRYRAEKDIEGMPYVLSGQLGMTYSIGKLPYAVLIDQDGIIASQGLVNTREHIESLFEAHRMKIATIQDYLALKNDGEDRRDNSVLQTY
ncbi:MAG: methylamine dehydrogenase accessory protein MauD [Sphingomonadaceae bacterium]|jgi:methylamine dehydrogenase accessory protein MauD|nr:methylamine dehydrogenase accessory protein MauD [Sphingomonadaceae bacterium]